MKELFNPLDYIPKYLKVIDKTGNLVPMTLFPVQKYYIENRSNRNIILKNRQTGMSTGIMADNSHALFTKQHERQTIITHDQETSEYLFQTVDRFYKNLPDDIRPETSWKSGTRMRFPELDSYIYIDSAKSDSIGIGHTLSRCHASEIAKWPHSKARSLYADLSQTVPLTGIFTIESTPKGRQGLFPELYQAGKTGDIPYKVFFFPWWWDITCVSDNKEFLEPRYIEKVAAKLNISTNELLSQETYLRESAKFTDAQLIFRRFKIMELGEIFFQEYPENDVDCWLSSEVSAIDGLTLKKYYELIKPGKQEGDLTIWKDVVGGHQYVIGVDTAAGLAKGDFSVASVLNVRNLEYVARIRGRMPPDLFAEQLFRLGKRYNEAEIGVEKVGHGHTVIRILIEKNYPNLYCYREYDEITKLTKFDYGWRTTSKSKPQMLDDLSSALRAGDLVSYSENLLNEANNLVIEKTASGSSKVVRASGYDDEWDAVSIGLQLRNNTPIFDGKRPGVSHYGR